MVSIHRQRTAL